MGVVGHCLAMPAGRDRMLCAAIPLHIEYRIGSHRLGNATPVARDLRLHDCDSSAVVDELRLADKGTGHNRREIHDFDLYSCAQLIFIHRWVQGRAHSGVCHRVHHPAVHDSVRVNSSSFTMRVHSLYPLSHLEKLKPTRSPNGLNPFDLCWKLFGKAKASVSPAFPSESRLRRHRLVAATCAPARATP